MLNIYHAPISPDLNFALKASHECYLFWILDPKWHYVINNKVPFHNKIIIIIITMCLWSQGFVPTFKEIRKDVNARPIKISRISYMHEDVLILTVWQCL